MKKLLLPFLFAFCLNVNSQVYNAGTMFSAYYDINPDTLLNYTLFPYTHESFGLNLYDDSSDDIRITADGAVSSGGTSAYISVISLNPNVYIRFGRWDSVYIPAYNFWDVTKVAKPLNAGDQINAAGAIWDTSLFYLTDHSGWGGGNKNVNDWIGSDKYIGLKYQNGSVIKYGWIRVRCKSKDSCYVKDYSYTPAAIAIQEIEQTKMKIFPNPVKDFFYLENVAAETFDVSKVKITDIYGKEIKFTGETKNKEVKINLDSNAPEGCYLLHWFFKDQPITGKFVKSFE